MHKRRFEDPRLPYQVVFEPKAFQTIRRYVQILPWTKEAGGQMFGRIDDSRIIVTEVTTPSTKDKRTRTSFVLDVPTANAEAAERFSRGLHYLGDWHTHPEDTPAPSKSDRENAGRMFKAATGRSFLLMAIAGRKETWVGIFNAKTILKMSEMR